MTENPLRDRTCMVGVGNTAYGNFPETDSYGLGAEALKKALDDAGLTIDDIDGMIVNRIPSYERFSEMVGLKNQTFGLQLQSSGRMSALSVMMATIALVTGQAKYIALVYGNNGRSVRDYYGGGPGLWSPWGFTSPGARHAMMFRRHMELYGTTTRQLAEVSVSVRYHACLNPDAVMRNPITIEDHESARFITAPLRLLDYCLINDGAVCMILTSKERAKDFRKPPVLISGFGAQETFSPSAISNFDMDFWYPAVKAAGEQARGMAGVTHDDIDALMCYDNFSPTVLFSLEGLGFCKQGEAGSFVENGALSLGGRLPVNTDGGHMSNSYMQGWALNVEAVRQLRGECGARQVPDCEVVQYVQATPCTRSIIYTRG